MAIGLRKAVDYIAEQYVKDAFNADQRADAKCEARIELIADLSDTNQAAVEGMVKRRVKALRKQAEKVEG